MAGNATRTVQNVDAKAEKYGAPVGRVDALVALIAVRIFTIRR
jgi:hypothetical protein